MQKKQKKAFTIVELVIVIAIIAILAAVLIPTFINLSKKAKENTDTQLVRNLNTALATDKALEGEHATMQSALDAAESFGYSVDKINASATDNEILWDSVNDVFCYLKDGAIEYIPNSVDSDKVLEAGDYQLWKIYGENDTVPAADEQTYSIYLNGASYTNALVGDELVVSVGLDVGTQSVEKISYKNESANRQEVTICTNGGTLTVNAPLDTVNHYSVINVVNVSDIAPTDCYHEYGTVKGTMNLAKGKVVLENGSNTGFVNVTAESANEIEIDIRNGAEYGRVTAGNETLLNAVKDKISSSEEVKTLVAAEGTVAIVNNVAYSDLETAKTSFNSTEGAKFELFTDVENDDFSNVIEFKFPKNGEFDGNGYTISGNIKLSVNSSGGKINDVIFNNIHNNTTRTSSLVYYYGVSLPGTLSAIYASGLSGELTIENCVFENIDWDAMQITPVAGAKITIKNNIFRMTEPEHYGQLRYIHVESIKNVDFSISIENNDFYNCENLRSEHGSAIEIYYPVNASKVVVSGNYIENINISAVVDNIATCPYACIGINGTSYMNSNTIILNNLKDTPNN